MPEYIVGAEDDDISALLAAVSGLDPAIVGAVAQAATTAKAQGRPVFNAKMLPQSLVGVPPTNIPASSAGVIIQVNVQRSIRPDRLVIDRVVAASTNVNDIKVGTVSLNASVNPVPGDMFAPDAIDTSIRAVETAIPAVGIQLNIGNATATAFTFRAGFIGPSMKN